MGPTPAKVGTIMTGIHRQPVLIPGPLAGSESLVFHRVEISRTAIGHRLKDLGSVSTGYSDRPWDPGKQLPLGLSLTGRQASSFKLDNGYGIV